MLRRVIPTVYQNAYNKLKFDELNVTGAREHARDLYAMLTKINRMAFKRIIKRAYLAAAIEARAAGYRPPPDDTKEREKATTAVFLALIMARKTAVVAFSRSLVSSGGGR